MLFNRRKLFQQVTNNRGSNSVYGANGSVPSYDTKAAEKKLRAQQEATQKAKAKRQGQENKAKLKAAQWNKKHGMSGKPTTVLAPIYIPTTPGPEINYAKENHEKWLQGDSITAKLSRGLNDAGEAVKNSVNDGWTGAKKTVNDATDYMGITQPAPNPEMTRDKIKERLKPVAEFYLDIRTPKQLDDYTENKLAAEFKEAERLRLEEKYEHYQRMGGQQTIEEFKKYGPDNTEKKVFNTYNENGDKITLTVYKDFPALVAAGAPTPPEQLATSSWDKYLIIQSRLEQNKKAAETADKVSGGRAPALFTVLGFANDTQQSVVDEQRRAMGWIGSNEGKEFFSIAAQMVKEHGIKPAVEGAAETAVRPVLIDLCRKRLKLPNVACEKIADELISKAIEKGVDSIPDGAN